jgi:splicing suppressor protein 51
LLPSWCNPQKRRECEWRARQSQFWSSLCAPVNKGGIVERYRDSMMPMKLRVLAEAVYGYDVMDQAR